MFKVKKCIPGKQVHLHKHLVNCSKRQFSMMENVSGIPGLYKISNFISGEEHDIFMEKMKNIQGQVDNYIQNSNKDKISKYYNHTSQKSFQQVKIEQDDMNPIHVEVFEKYGEEGHMLVYCGTSNIPHFISSQILQKFNQEKVKDIITQNVNNSNNIEWKISLNFYSPIQNGDSTQYSGFPFHRDIASIGNMTTVLSLGDYGLLQYKEPSIEYEGFRPKGSDHQALSTYDHDHEVNNSSHDPNSVKTILVEPNSLILMSGPSRWNYLHRVVPTGQEFEFENKIYKRTGPRFSIVLSCK